MPNRSGLALAVALLGLAGPAPERAILRPAADSVLDPGTLTVIVRAEGGELRLDGRSLETVQPARGVLTATVAPSAGTHELVLATAGVEEKIRFHVGSDPAPPAEWKRYRPHPPEVACETCHRISEGKWVLEGEVAGPACMACHDAGAFPKTHTHVPRELEECQLCHDPHGSTDARHLKMTREIACKQCHG